jgi:hypothetical protein
MVCGPAPLPQTSLYSVYPPFDQEAYWAEEDHTAAIAALAPRTSTTRLARTGRAKRTFLIMSGGSNLKLGWAGGEALR